MRKKLFKILVLFIAFSSIEIKAAEGRLACDSHLGMKMSESSLLTLEDGSKWQVFGSDQESIKVWFDHHDLAPLTISPNYMWGGGYNGYLLTYQDNESQMLAHLVDDPLNGNPCTVTITGMDKDAHGNPHKSFYRGCVYLSNGTFWVVSMFDRDVMENWEVGDVVILGKEGGWFPYDTHILINAQTRTFVRIQKL